MLLKVPQSASNLHRRDMLWVFLVAVFLRATFLLGTAGQIGIDNLLTVSPDSARYVEAARLIAEGRTGYESTFVIFGPGFPVLLAVFFKLFGPSFLPFLFVQIALSSLSCVLIYRLASRLTGSRAIAVIAGVLSAFSITSICLCCVILSDIVFLFLLLLALELFFGGLDSDRLWRFVLAGFLLMAAIFIRSIGQFLPLLLIPIAVGYLWNRGSTTESIPVPLRRRVLQVGLCVMIVVSGQVAWIARNHQVNGFAAPALTSASGPGKVAALTLESLTGRPHRDILNEWSSQYMKDSGLTAMTPADQFNLLRMKTSKVLADHTQPMVNTYLKLAWENLNDISYFHRAIFPQSRSTTIPLEGTIKKWNLNYLPFVMSVIGLLLLILSGNKRSAFILGLLYLYFALMIGFTKWQGSRIFLPGQTAWPILVAVTLCTVGTKTKSFIAKFRSAKRFTDPE